jgi:hypothetical protein
LAVVELLFEQCIDGAIQLDGNFLIGNSHDPCVFHVSESVTAVRGNYRTGLGHDALYYEYFAEHPGGTSGAEASWIRRTES